MVDRDGRVEEKWCTLLNPERDLGPQHIHGIAAADVASAPHFADVASHLLNMLRGRVLVAHNLRFDLAFIDAEYDRIGVPFPVTYDAGLCTMSLATRYLEGAGRSLRDCCAAAGFRLEGWHSALSDANATAALLGHYLEVCGMPPPWRALLARATEMAWPRLAGVPFTVSGRTPISVPTDRHGGSLIAQLVDFMPRVDTSDMADPYLAVLDEALADRYLSRDENGALAALAKSLGLRGDDVRRLHEDYLNALARVALADHHLSEIEKADLRRVASILGLAEGAVSSALETATQGQLFDAAIDRLPLKRGDLIVFTGDMDEPRELWMQRAAEHGFVPHPNVTKKVRLVVAADPHSLSGKAKKARGYDIPIISVAEFRRVLGYPEPIRSVSGSNCAWSNSERKWAEILREEMGR